MSVGEVQVGLACSEEGDDEEQGPEDGEKETNLQCRMLSSQSYCVEER